MTSFQKGTVKSVRTSNTHHTIKLKYCTSEYLYRLAHESASTNFSLFKTCLDIITQRQKAELNKVCRRLVRILDNYSKLG